MIVPDKEIPITQSKSLQKKKDLNEGKKEVAQKNNHTKKKNNNNNHP